MPAAPMTPVSAAGEVAVVMPAYNAGRTLERVFARIPAAADRRIARYLVVDDGSGDDTLAVLGRIAARRPKVEILRHRRNRGYGAAEKTLLNAALDRGAGVAVVLHADGQYSPELLPAILAPFDGRRADVVQGSRMLAGGALAGGMPLYKFVANKALTFVENRGFGMAMAEFHSGYMAYGRAFLQRTAFNRLSESFDFDLEMLVAARVLGMRICEVPIPTIYGDEKSHLDPVRYGLDVLQVVRRYRGGHYHRLLGV